MPCTHHQGVAMVLWLPWAFFLCSIWAAGYHTDSPSKRALSPSTLTSVAPEYWIASGQQLPLHGFPKHLLCPESYASSPRYPETWTQTCPYFPPTSNPSKFPPHPIVKITNVAQQRPPQPGSCNSLPHPCIAPKWARGVVTGQGQNQKLQSYLWLPSISWSSCSFAPACHHVSLPNWWI